MTRVSLSLSSPLLTAPRFSPFTCLYCLGFISLLSCGFFESVSCLLFVLSSLLLLYLFLIVRFFFFFVLLYFFFLVCSFDSSLLSSFTSSEPLHFTPKNSTSFLLCQCLFSFFLSLPGRQRGGQGSVLNHNLYFTIDQWTLLLCRWFYDSTNTISDYKHNICGQRHDGYDSQCVRSVFIHNRKNA